ncbi:UDP-N-acetylmuramoyl-tripeptide--D-alanyl-D-alanine ligase [Fructobacillus ficulneus]|uniref:UDP-N-acetylmuramoyl-tripeptide--D-alanyl-D-alanine ligase n=1 Tax=Fructobacillus ficulneus TaxID=157463 RepID=A0A0K8MH20_9LACO|nr:UDP-N-acetylmuramoyl-tripeptide--D-alanyl-D-alanine ligase [Fructobacillus ficulneus]GAO99772.1 UDP-N-acetylmuramoyl-tripeptide--D-alanyl-D-alanine ligase [Fructobacillus ficulneus]
MNLSLKTVAQATQGKIQGFENPVITGVAFDSRQVQPGDLFVALVGENDGHAYLDQAKKAGAVAALVQDDHQVGAVLPAVSVADTLVGLQDLAKAYLAEVSPKVVAITGSNGKTTTKDMVAAILAQKYQTFKTPENFNNEIGLPVTILSMPENTEVLVLEMGMDRPGQLTFLSQLARPDVAIITMIGEAHLEFFHTRANIAKAKLEITAGLKSGGLLLIPADEPLLTEASELPAETKTFGPEPTNCQETLKETKFVDQGQKFAIPLLGRYNVRNALSAIRVGQAFGLNLETIATALKNFALTKNRTQMLTAQNGALVISDVYNANPTATKEVLQALAQEETQDLVVVLGDMLELGDQGPALHAGLKDAVLAAQPKAVYLVGDLMVNNLGPALLKSDLSQTKIYNYQKNEIDQLTDDLNQRLQANDCLFLKASHGIHLEKVLDKIIANQN